MPLVPHVTPGSVISSAWGNLVADHVVMRFSTAAQRTTQLPTPLTGQLTSLDSAPGSVQAWSGTAWVDVAAVTLERFLDLAPALDTGPGQAFAYDIPAMVLPRTGPVIVDLQCTCTSTVAGSGRLRFEAGTAGGAPAILHDAYVGMPGGAFNSTVPAKAAWPSLAAGTSFSPRMRLTNLSGGGTIRLAAVTGSIRVSQAF